MTSHCNSNHSIDHKHAQDALNTKDLLLQDTESTDDEEVLE